MRKKNNILKTIIIACCILYVSVSIAEEYKGNWHGSLMFSITDDRKINEILEAYRNEQNQPKKSDDEKSKGEIVRELMESLNITTENFLKNLPKEAPAFYLNSIAYISNENWSIWINGKKSSFQRQEISDLVIEEVNKDRVRFSWSSEYMKYINANWQRINDENIKVDVREKRIYFTLRPNQTFETINMKIAEGKKKSTPIFYDKTPIAKGQPLKVLTPGEDIDMDINNAIIEEK